MLKVLWAGPWLFDIVKRVLTYSLRLGAGRRARLRGLVLRPDGVKRVMIAEFVRRNLSSNKIYRPLAYLRFCLGTECRVRL